MSSKGIAISVRGVSKSYTIAHQIVREPGAAPGPGQTAPSPVGRFQRLQKETFWALRDISFDVNHGDVVGIIGRNGAGKSTLLKILSRITVPTEGIIDLYGRVGSLLEVGTGFHPELTGRENIFLNGAIIGMRHGEIKRQFDQIVDFAGVENFLDTPVKRYSSGMYVRLAFAVAAHLQPEILIVDEVLAVGDKNFQKKCLGKMGEVAREGRTVLFVSHNLEAVRKLCSRGILMDHGQLVMAGEVRSVIGTYIEAGAGAKAVYDIDPVTEDGAPACAYRVTVENAQGEPVSEVLAGQPWQVRINFRVQRRTEHFIIALGLLTPLDSPLRTTWSPAQDLEPGEYEVVYRDNVIQLEPGSYPFVIGLSEQEQTFQYIEKAGALQIAEITEGMDAAQMVRLVNCGFVLNQLDVSIHKRS